MSANDGIAAAWRLARRELRGGLGGFRIFLACLTLGVAAIAGVGSLSEAVEGGLRNDARRLLGGDVSIRLIQRTAEPAQKAYFAAAGDVSETVEMRAMARAELARKRTLVELKAVDNAYPLVGEIELDGGGDLGAALVQKDGVWGAVVERGLLTKLKIKPADRIRVGDASFVLRGVIGREPDRVASVLSFGPRMMVAAAALKSTGLILPGSQIRYRYRVGLRPELDAKAWIAGINENFPSAGWRVRSTEEVAPGLRRFIDRMTLFLTFVGLTTLLVGGVGITNAVASYLDERARTIATLKCLGAPASLIFQVYFLQIMALTGIGLILGLGIGAGLPALAASLLEPLLPFRIIPGVHAGPLIIAAVFGVLIAITFALWPLARARDIPAANLFRAKVQPNRGRPRGRYLAATAALVIGLAALTIATASDRWFAVWFVAGAGLSLALLNIGATAIMAAARRFKNIRHTESRLAIANLHRPGATTRSVVTSLGLGLGVLVAIALIEGNLNNQIQQRIPKMAPAFFFLDIQPHQVAGFDKTLRGFEGTGDYKRVATIRGRIVGIAGTPVTEATIKPGSAWAVRGDRVLTYAAKPRDGDIFTAGEWWPENYRGPPLISLDAHIAHDFGVKTGDTLTINVLGRDIQAKIANLRAIDWRSMRFNFAIIFSPGALDNAPQTHVAAIQAPRSLEDSIERAIGDKFNNISIIRVREALQSAADLLRGIGGAIRATAAVTILGGALVLAGVVAANRRRRVFDAVVFKVLGATRGAIFRAFLIEYGLLGIATGLLAAAIGTLTAWAIVVLLMDMQWRFSPGIVALTVAACILLTLVAGFAGTWWALGQKSAPLLRNE
ncbi:MAG: FtsX-like permease family protein [Rhodospirillaceae bacterium]|nr:FtsX-like permease family protein [Rhodospirillaceae bacterium]